MSIKKFYTGVYVGDNLGVGTVSPSAKLEVAADATTNVDIVHFSNSNDIAKAKISLSANSSGELSLIDGSNNTDVFITSNGDSYFNGGDVGIGTTSPGKKLDVNSAATSDIARFGNTSGNFTLGQTTALTSLDLAASNAYRIRQGSTTPFYIKSDGNVGIGTTSPSAKLDVAGGVKVANDTDTAGITKVGTLRYRYVPGSPKNFSYVDMCMQTGASSYAWVNIVQNVWN